MKKLSTDELSQLGKEKFAESDVAEKINSIREMKNFDNELTNYKELRKTMESGKSFIVVHCSTTGLAPDDQITQLTALRYAIKDNQYAFVDSYKKLLSVDEKILERAINNQNYDFVKKSGFGIPASENGLGITIEEYKSGKHCVTSKQASVDFAEYIKDDVVIGFNTEKFLIPTIKNNLGIELNKVIDLHKAIIESDALTISGAGNKDYCYCVGKNSGYSIEKLSRDILGEDKEMFTAYSKATNIFKITNIVYEKELMELSDKNLDVEITEPTITVKEGIPSNKMSKSEAPKSEVSKDVSTGHGNLYSDMKGDVADVVIGNVTKVGEVSIPHISEAIQEVTNQVDNASKNVEFTVPNDTLSKIYEALSIIGKNLETLTKTIEKTQKQPVKRTKRTIDKTEEDRGNSITKVLPTNVIKDDLKGHETKEKEEIENAR